jgi:hypothetical protein
MTDILEQSWSWDVYVLLALIGWIAGIFVGAGYLMVTFLHFLYFVILLVAVGGILIGKSDWIGCCRLHSFPDAVPLALLSGHDAKIAVASNKLAYLAAGTKRNKSSLC